MEVSAPRVGVPFPERVHDAVRRGVLARRWVMDDPARLPEAVRAVLEAHNG